MAKIMPKSNKMHKVTKILEFKSLKTYWVEMMYKNLWIKSRLSSSHIEMNKKHLNLYSQIVSLKMISKFLQKIKRSIIGIKFLMVNLIHSIIKDI